MFDPRQDQMVEMPEEILAGGSRYHARLRRRVGLTLLTVVATTFAGLAFLAY